MRCTLSHAHYSILMKSIYAALNFKMHINCEVLKKRQSRKGKSIGVNVEHTIATIPRGKVRIFMSCVTTSYNFESLLRHNSLEPLRNANHFTASVSVKRVREWNGIERNQHT